MATAAEQLMAYLRRLEDLNPEVSLSDLCQADAWAQEAGGAAFADAAAQTAKLIDLYLQSQTKQQGAEVLAEYFHCLSEDAQRLLEAGEISAPVQTTADDGRQSHDGARSAADEHGVGPLHRAESRHGAVASGEGGGCVPPPQRSRQYRHGTGVPCLMEIGRQTGG